MSTQDRILNYVREHIDNRGYPPSVREIGEAVGLASSSSVQGHLERLEKKGLIRRKPQSPRAIELLDTPKRKIPAAEIERVIDDLENKIAGCHSNGYRGLADAYEYAADELKKVLA